MLRRHSLSSSSTHSRSSSSFHQLSAAFLSCTFRFSSSTIAPSPLLHFPTAWTIKSVSDSAVTVQLEGKELCLPARWIAHNSTSVRHESGQRFETTEQFLARSAALQSTTITAAKTIDEAQTGAASDGGVLQVTFANGTVDSVPLKHITKYAAKTSLVQPPFLKKEASTDPQHAILTGAENIARVQFAHFSPIASVADKAVQADKDKAMRGLLRDGIIIVEGCPNSNESVLQLADYLGAPAGATTTLYGKTFLVQRQPPVGPTNNIAYTGEYLDLHNDLVYFQSMPGLQLLHCMEFADSVQGGLSFFADAAAAANRLRAQHPAAFNLLATVPTAWMKDDLKRDVPAMYYYAAPIFQLDAMSGEITCVRWAPAFEAPLPLTGYPQQLSLSAEGKTGDKKKKLYESSSSSSSSTDSTEALSDLVNEYFEAYGLFAKVLKAVREEQRLELRLKPGETVIFNQARLLHGRTAFVEQRAGDRKLHGCYVNIDDFRSRCMTRLALSGLYGNVPNWSLMNGSSR